MKRRTFRRRASSLVVLVVLLAGGCSAESSDPRFLDKTTISVALHNDIPGVSLLENYRRTGIDYLLAQMIDTRLGLKSMVPTETSSIDRIPKLVTGKVDMVIASFSITAARMREIDFVGPYLTTRQGFLVGPNGADVRFVSDLAASGCARGRGPRPGTPSGSWRAPTSRW
jgi:glutamate transport system substrate-binding protein